MKLVLQRTKFDSVCTEGEISIEGTFQCFSLELPVRDALPGSAIPPGSYPVKLQPSPKFMMSSDPWVAEYAALIPHVLDIPNRSDILIHWGNDPANTEGCILVGQTSGVNFISNSRLAFAALWEKLESAAGHHWPITLDVIGGIPSVSRDRS
jgi:hypothetical protein